MKTNFYLKTPNAKESLILLSIQTKGVRIRTTFDIKVPCHSWNYSKQRLKSNIKTIDDGKIIINDLLNGIEKHLSKQEAIWLTKGVPSQKVIKSDLKQYIENPGSKTRPLKRADSLFKLIERFISGEIKYNGKNKSPATLKSYRVTYKHLTDFEKKKSYPVEYESINLVFYNKFLDYLMNKSLQPNSIGGQIKNIKVFMNEAVDMEYTENLAFRSRKFKCPSEESESIALNDEEIAKLLILDLSDNKRLDSVRDYFILGCHTGLRHSDWKSLKHEIRFQDKGMEMIKIRTQKGESPTVVIPFNPVIKYIFDKYDQKLPRAISNQKFNEYIKEIGKMAQLNETGRISKYPDKKVWELIGSHTARRSFATNLYLSGHHSYEIMKITGHKTEKSFLKYIKIDKLESAHRLHEHYKLQDWSAVLSKVS